MSLPKKVQVRYTGKESIRTMIGNQIFAQWKKGDVYEVNESKAQNHVRYPFFEYASEKDSKKLKEIDLKESETNKKPEVEETVNEKPKKAGKKGKKEKPTIKNSDEPSDNDLKDIEDVEIDE